MEVLLFILFLSQSLPAQAQPLSDDELLEKVQRHGLQYFLQESHPETGLVRDRAHPFQRGATASPASVAAVGFALTVYPVAVERGWMDRSLAMEITRRTLLFFLERAPHEHGFLYHYLKMDTGERAHRSEVSPIDTALFLAGALFAAEYFGDWGIRDLATKFYERVDWPWMLHGAKTFALAWTPEGGFERRRWDHYDESMILYLLALGSPTHPIPAESWQEIARPVGSYGGHRLIQMPPLFTHQYSHIWIDFRNKNDGHADYFQNSIDASLANRAFVIDESTHFAGYGPDAWGLTASDGPFGYRAYGAPPGWAEHDGTLAPTGCGSSIVFTPRESIACLRHLYQNYQDRLWGPYGFSSAFNLDKNWFSRDVIGVDQGALILMIENYRSGFVWKIMGHSAFLGRGMERAGFREGTMPLPWPDPPVHRAPYVPGGLRVDGYLRDWPNGEAIVLDPGFKESGVVDGRGDLGAEIRFAWDETFLYFYAKVTDDHVMLRKAGQHIWQDDLLELFVDPQGDGLFWYNEGDFQIGVRAPDDKGEIATWSWFQGGEDPGRRAMVVAQGFTDDKGYLVEGAVRWAYLGVRPVAGKVVRVSPAVHDIDRDRQHGKLMWFFRNEDSYRRFVLGRVSLEGPKGVKGEG